MEDVYIDIYSSYPHQLRTRRQLSFIGFTFLLATRKLNPGEPNEWSRKGTENHAARRHDDMIEYSSLTLPMHPAVIGVATMPSTVNICLMRSRSRVTLFRAISPRWASTTDYPPTTPESGFGTCMSASGSASVSKSVSSMTPFSV